MTSESSLSSDFELPKDLLLSVLSYLSPRSLAKASSTSHRWHEATMSAEVWQRRASPSLLRLSMREAQNIVRLDQRADRQSEAVRILSAVLHTNLFRNPSFLERENNLCSCKAWVLPRRWNAPSWHYAMSRNEELGCDSSGNTVWNLYDLPSLLEAVSSEAHSREEMPPLLGKLIPLGAGCLACQNDWSEAVQLVDLHKELLSNGVPKHLVPIMLETCALTLGLSIWVTGLPGAETSAVQLVAMMLNEKRMSQVLSVSAAGEAGGMGHIVGGPQLADHVGLVSLMMIPPGKRLCERRVLNNLESSSFSRGAMLHAQAVPETSDHICPEVMRTAGMTQVVLGPVTAPTGTWRQLRLKLPIVHEGHGGRRYVAVALRGRSKPPCGYFSGIRPNSEPKAFGGPRFAQAELRFLGQDELASWDNTNSWSPC